MNKRFLVVLCILLFIVYMNRAYARIYDTIGEQNLKPPTNQKVFILENKMNKNPAIKYIALGDSLSLGVGTTNYQNSFTYLLAEKLEKALGKITFINLSQAGAKTDDVIKNQLPQTLQQEPDFVTLLIGINDIHNLVSEENFKKNYTEIITQLSTKTKAQIIAINIPYLGSNQLLLPPYNYLVYLRTAQFNKIISKITQDRQIKMINLYDKSKEAFSSNSMLYSADWFHPSPQGYKIWANLINAN